LRQERQTGTDGYRVFIAADLAAAAAFFFWLALSACACFWFDFFWFDFGDLSPIIFISFNWLIHLRHVSFSGGAFMMLGGVVIVNDGHNIIRQRPRLPGKDNCR
jgi:hypothetical protein